MTYNEFKQKIQKLEDHRTHKITNSNGVYSAYKWIRKNKWLDIGRPLLEKEFYSIIRTINNYLAEELIKGNDVIFPKKMGKLELRKRKSRISIVDGKIKSNLPIDWDKTLKLWYEDEESYNNKTLIKMEEKEIFEVRYDKTKANFQNKTFYQFKVNRDIKLKLKQQIKEGRIDAFNLL